eukprot:Nk52_evm16s2340 gene=Nk52_evmTU16s2340
MTLVQLFNGVLEPNPIIFFDKGNPCCSNDKVIKPQCDISESSTEITFKTNFPGVKKEDLKVEFEDGLLTLEGKTEEEREEVSTDETVETDGDAEAKGPVTWHFTERTSGFYRRQFRLPENADIENAAAAYENGVLTLSVPKAVPPKPEAVKINVS